MEFVGGSLKLKSKTKSRISKKLKKKKTKDRTKTTDAVKDKGSEKEKEKEKAVQDYVMVYANGGDEPSESQKTESERRLEETQRRRLLEKGEVKSYEEKMKEYNRLLGSQSEHFDMPKIGPG
ncbi:hypothetical protein SJAG_02899 [Schizosaccharomyces japonicus yFS275]|uniref:DUF1754 family protein n=1 Tax=Schizosaccharomyces japonicus (strain yFS275 / FY16936) TaxID=402676 RepID=B6K1H0_SCHJY|nr:hypothetical protein SJAG_02899 [Schizosaccharomyces japonicus yFS275]EEB07791.1 hypothetical protein SJAG_02899 [Schizosaccharomyces japonicus yFS275]